MNIRPICSIDRAHNAWIVTVNSPVPFAGIPRSYVCLTWEEVEKAARDAAFPFPDKNEPRVP